MDEESRDILAAQEEAKRAKKEAEKAARKLPKPLPPSPPPKPRPKVQADGPIKQWMVQQRAQPDCA